MTGLEADEAPAVQPPSPLDVLDPSTLANLRDLGGLPVESGGTTLFGVLYRSDAPRWRDSSPSGVVAWPPRTVIDLRSAVERGRHPHPLTSDGTTVHTIPLLGDQIDENSRTRATDALYGGLETLYAAMLDFAAPRLVEVAHLIAEAPAPILVHCAAGKDRTGMVSALMLRAAGVPGPTVIADYAETAKNMTGVMQRMGNRSLLPGAERLGADLTATSVPAAEQVLRVLDGHPGGAHGWLLGAGADPAALTAWRARFVGE
nr:tyrosine-protein phosphatase [Micromonospora sp. DSM 115978]